MILSPDTVARGIEVPEAEAWQDAHLVLTNAPAPENWVLEPWQLVVYRREVSPR